MSLFILINDLHNDERTAFFSELYPQELEEESGLKLIGAVSEEGYPEGVLAFSLEGWSAHILHIEVYPDLRRKGIGTALVGALMDYLSPLEQPYVVEAVFEQEEEAEGDPLMDFFSGIPDFQVVSSGKYCTVTPDTVWNSQRLALLENFTCFTKSVLELSSDEKTELGRYLREKNMEKLIEWDEKKIIPELSLCNTENGICTSLVVFEKSDQKRTLELSFLMCRPDELDKLSGILNEVIKLLKVMYPRYSLVFCLINKESELIAKRFFTKDIKVSEIYEAVSYGKVE